MNEQYENNLSDPIDILETNFKSVVDELTSHASDTQTREARASTSFFSKTTKLITDHPIAAIGIAFGAGFFLVRLLRR